MNGNKKNKKKSEKKFGQARKKSNKWRSVIRLLDLYTLDILKEWACKYVIQIKLYMIEIRKLKCYTGELSFIFFEKLKNALK